MLHHTRRQDSLACLRVAFVVSVAARSLEFYLFPPLRSPYEFYLIISRSVFRGDPQRAVPYVEDEIAFHSKTGEGGKSNKI